MVSVYKPVLVPLGLTHPPYVVMLAHSPLDPALDVNALLLRLRAALG